MGVDPSVSIAFIGYATPGRADEARAYEDQVLRLLPAHGARVVYRGHRRPDEDQTLPVEVQILSFPSRSAFESYLGDPRRGALMDQFGDVFDRTVVVEVDPIQS